MAPRKLFPDDDPRAKAKAMADRDRKGPRQLFPGDRPDPKEFKAFMDRRGASKGATGSERTQGKAGSSRSGPPSLKPTAGGTGPKAKSSSGGGKMSAFESSFSQARKAGKATFTFNGKSYNTRYKGEGANVKAKSSSNKAAATPDPNPGVKHGTGGPQGGRVAGKVGGANNQLRAATLKAFWGGMQPNMRGPGEARPSSPPASAAMRGPGQARTAVGPPAATVARDATPRIPASAAPPPMAPAYPGPVERAAEAYGDFANAAGERIAGAPQRWGGRVQALGQALAPPAAAARLEDLERRKRQRGGG